ncbi:hypothetical protein [Terrarubrum flagellatum]|uniref:hypothetical protein n=1 Tax=Terrirubrum flagellatum TaxID=2895980 RepID=UPI00314527A1
MSIYKNAELKLDHIVSLIDDMIQQEAPFEKIPNALRQIKHVFELYRAKLQRAKKTNEARLTSVVCENINQKIFETISILGFLMRSSNLRNSFEVLYPLEQIARKIIASKVYVLISSEWDYIPSRSRRE